MNPIQRFLEGDVGHGVIGGGAVLLEDLNVTLRFERNAEKHFEEIMPVDAA